MGQHIKERNVIEGVGIMNEPRCLRCGKCCHLVDSVTKRPGIKTCTQLVKLKGGRTLCRIYSNKGRLGKDIGAGNQCNHREDIRWDFEGCPYNKDRILVLDLELGI